MSNFCDHCRGQRFDRARVLRTLRQLKRRLRAGGRGGKAEEALRLALEAVGSLDIPHLETDDDEEADVVH